MDNAIRECSVAKTKLTVFAIKHENGRFIAEVLDLLAKYSMDFFDCARALNGLRGAAESQQKIAAVKQRVV